MIKYNELLNTKLLEVFIEVLKDIEKNGLNDKNHLYITFNTLNVNNDIPNWLLEKYPDEITILIQYEYLSITAQSVTLSSVPTQTYVDSSIQSAAAETGASSGSDAARTKTKQKKAVVSEIKKRYTAEIPHVHVHEHAHIHKKKWTGLQGQFLTEQKRDDLGKDRLKKI